MAGHVTVGAGGYNSRPRRRLRQFSALLLLALVVAAAVLPITAAGAERRGCHCPVKMACCEDGMCTMDRGGDEPPSAGPEWRTCRRDAPAAPTLPLDAFERALAESLSDTSTRTTGRIAAVSTGRPHSATPIPATAPPRLSSF